MLDSDLLIEELESDRYALPAAACCPGQWDQHCKDSAAWNLKSFRFKLLVLSILLSFRRVWMYAGASLT